VRYVSPMGSTTVDGTNVEIETVVNHIISSAQKVVRKPSCLHDVRDTRKPELVNTGWKTWDDL
jgi:hypothetical protein